MNKADYELKYVSSEDIYKRELRLLLTRSPVITRLIMLLAVNMVLLIMLVFAVIGFFDWKYAILLFVLFWIGMLLRKQTPTSIVREFLLRDNLKARDRVAEPIEKRLRASKNAHCRA